MKPEIIVTTKLFPRTQERLDKEFTCHKLHEAADRAAFLKELAPRVRALATFGPAGADAKLMDALPKLELISNFGVGVDAIDLAAAKQRKIIVTNTPDVLNDCVADTAMALTLNVMRKFPQSEGYLRAGFWATRGGYPLTTSLGGKTMGILGLGRIGEAIAQARAEFRHEDPVPQPQEEGRRLPVRRGRGGTGEEFRRADGGDAGRRGDREDWSTRRCWMHLGPRATWSTSRAAR